MNSFLMVIFAFAITMSASFAQTCKDAIFAFDGQAAKLYSTSESLICVAQKQKYQCDDLEKELEDADKNKIIKCDSKSLAQNSLSNISIADCVWNGLKVSGEQLLDLAKLPGVIADSISKGFKDTQLCNQSIDKKREILKAFNLSIEDKRFQLSEQFLGHWLEDAPCSEIEKLVSARYQNYTQTLYRERIAAINTGKKTSEVGMAKNDSSDLMKNIKEAFQAAEVRYGCYTPKVKAEMMCSAVTTILADIATGMGIKGAIAKLSSLKALRKVKRAVAAGEKVDLKDASKLLKAERLKAAETMLKRELTEAEKKAVMEAHEVGIKEGRGFYTYTQEDITKKARLLREAGLDKDQVRTLMENGVTGTFDNPTMRKAMVDHMKKKTAALFSITQEDTLVAIHNLGSSSAPGFADKAKGMLKAAGFKDDQIEKILLAKSNMERGIKDTVAAVVEKPLEKPAVKATTPSTTTTATTKAPEAPTKAPEVPVVADSIGRKAVLNNFKDDKLAHFKPSNQKEAQELMKRLEKTNNFDVQGSMLSDAESISKARKGIAEYEEKLAKLPPKGMDMSKKDLADKLDRAKTSLEMYQKRCKGAMELYREAYNISQYMKSYETVYERGCK
jgi:hypothetical protein